MADRFVHKPEIRPGSEYEDLLTAVAEARPNDLIIYYQGTIPTQKVREAAMLLHDKGYVSVIKRPDRPAGAPRREWSYMMQVREKK